MKNNTTFLHIIDFDIEKCEVLVRASYGSDLSGFFSYSGQKKILWKSSIIDYPLAEEWKENTDKYEIVDFLNDSLGQRPFWIYPINGVGSKGVRHKVSDRKSLG